MSSTFSCIPHHPLACEFSSRVIISVLTRVGTQCSDILFGFCFPHALAPHYPFPLHLPSGDTTLKTVRSPCTFSTIFFDLHSCLVCSVLPVHGLQTQLSVPSFGTRLPQEFLVKFLTRIHSHHPLHSHGPRCHFRSFAHIPCTLPTPVQFLFAFTFETSCTVF